MWSKIRKILGVLTDLLTSGRKAGLWNEKPGIGKPPSLGSPHDPGFPDVK